MAQFMGPAALVRHRRPQPAQGPDQTRLAIGGDELQKLSVQAPAPQIPQKPIPGILALGFDDLEINQLSLALAGDAIST